MTHLSTHIPLIENKIMAYPSWAPTGEDNRIIDLGEVLAGQADRLYFLVELDIATDAHDGYIVHEPDHTEFFVPGDVLRVVDLLLATF